MFDLKIPFNQSALDRIKGDLTRVLPHIKSSHRCEAIGRGLGFGTYAAALAASAMDRAATVTVRGAPFSFYLETHGFEASPTPFYRAAAKAVLSDIAARNPKLTMWGIGVGRPQRKPDGKLENAHEKYARFLEARQELASDGAAEAFLLSLALLARIAPTKTVRQGTGSYWVKHIAENFACSYPEGEKLGPRYVSNGVLIAAAIHAGFRTKSYVDEYGYDDLNVNFNMSKPFLEDLDCEVRPKGPYAHKRTSLRSKSFSGAIA
ncbi:hypothetical protein [Mesorhizobium sp. M0959]|uniref:hypothetical protein n=1 Tax=unclassified Mesorhizobium TaxID=325217 RepID=UPI003336B46A